MKTSEDLVAVYTSMGPLAAEVIKSKLESAGIPAMLQYESVSRVFPVTVDGLGEVRVLVPSAYAAEARAVLAEDEQPMADG